MPGQTIGTVNVQIGQPTNPRAIAINYGTGRTLKSLTDVNASAAVSGDTLIYDSTTDTFIVEPITNTNLRIDNGYF
jgi:hypothetical protein